MIKIQEAIFLSVIFLIFGLTSVYSQLNLNVKVSASNLLRYGVGEEENINGNTSKKYFEELADVRLFVNDFMFGARYEYDDPIEFGKGTKGISRRFVEFKKAGFTVRAGNYYDIFAKGLTFNAFESRPIGFNAEMDGARIFYKNEFGKKSKIKLNSTILMGGMDFTDINDTSRTEQYSIRAGNFSVSPIKYVTIGGSYLYTHGKIPTGNDITEIDAEIFEGNFGFNWKGFDLVFSYANKVTISTPNSLYPQSKAPRGDGAYGSIAYTREGFGISVDYKNYRFNLVTPDQRSASDPFKPLPFQNAPSCIKVYSSTLLSRFPHNVDFGDEVGFQVDLFYSPSEKLTFNANASFTSRHYDYRDADTSTLTRYERIERNSFLPSLEDALSPYWEVYLEAEYYASKQLKTKLGVARKTNVLYSIVDPSSSDIIRTFTVPIEIQYAVTKAWSVKINAEFQRAYNSLRAGEKYFNNQYTTLALSHSPNLIFAASLEFTDDEEDVSGKKTWAKGELTYKFNSANTVTLSYGSERGGLQCSSGICRYVNPFKGFRLTIANNFN
jgi:hypothetical protein